MNTSPVITGFITALLLGSLARAAEPGKRPAIEVRQISEGKLLYTADENGHRVIDFSHASYGGGGVMIPMTPAKILELDLTADRGAFHLRWLEWAGELQTNANSVRGGSKVPLQPPIAGAKRRCVAWLTRHT